MDRGQDDMEDRRDAAQAGCKTERNTGKIGCKTGEMED